MVFLPHYMLLGGTKLICSTTDNIHFDYLINMVSDRFLHYQVSSFPFAMKFFVGLHFQAGIQFQFIHLFTYVSIIDSYFIQWVTIHYCDYLL